MTFFRAICFFGVVLTTLFLPLPLFVLTALVYAFIFSPYEVLAFAVLVDAQFGDTETPMWYAYTLVASLALLISVYAKPFLRFYQ